jgi:site-specific recombinase XerD
LRQVTRDDVTGWLDGRKHQANDASALRDLFRTLKSERLVFTNPTDRVRVVKPNQTTPNPGSAPKHCN